MWTTVAKAIDKDAYKRYYNGNRAARTALRAWGPGLSGNVWPLYYTGCDDNGS